MRYRKKPVIVDAWKFNGEGFHDWPQWLRQKGFSIRRIAENRLDIETLEGMMFCNIGDFIILGVQGEIYPCKPDIFEATYEAVE